jgi:hypothetical protein
MYDHLDIDLGSGSVVNTDSTVVDEGRSRVPGSPPLDGPIEPGYTKKR